MQINNHRSLFDRNVANSSFEIEHFNFHWFKNLKIKILKKIFDNAYQLSSGRFYNLCAKSLQRHGLNTKIFYDTESPIYVYNLFSIVCKPPFHYSREKREGHSNKSLFVRYKNKNPVVVLHDLYNLFIKNYNIKEIKTILFSLKLKIFRRLQQKIKEFI